MTVRPTERECEDTIIAAALMLGYMVHAERPARSRKGWRTPVRGNPGWPDLVICGHGRLLIVELKRKQNRLDEAQQAWIDALEAAGADARLLWVPEQQQGFIDELTRWARPREADHRNPFCPHGMHRSGLCADCYHADADRKAQT